MSTITIYRILGTSTIVIHRILLLPCAGCWRIAAKEAYEQSLTSAYWLARLTPVAGRDLRPFGDGLGGMPERRSKPIAVGAPVRQRGLCFVSPRAGGCCGVASAFACFDFFFDFVALCGRIGADGAFALAAVAPTTGRRGSRANICALHGWRRPAGDCAGFGADTGSRRGQATSHHPGQRAQAEACARETGAISAGNNAEGTYRAVALRDRRSQRRRRSAGGATDGEPDDGLWRGPQCASGRAQS
jgi:hypothetical protein